MDDERERRSGEADVIEEVEELRRTVEELRAELRGPPRGPLGLPRPPTPREVARFTAEYGIPTAVATLEATVRSLELLQAALRAADPGGGDGVPGPAMRDRAERAGGAVLDRLDAALADLEAAVEEGGLPTNPAARELLLDARELTRETRDALAAGGATESDGAPGTEVDVEEELETIREQVHEEGDTEPGSDPD
jgi:hypothetical protein